MSKYAVWFHEQLQNSAEGFVWGTGQVPEARWYAPPPKGLGEWTVARHVFHLWYYEQTIALPSMRQWLGGTIPPVEDGDEDIAWSKTVEGVESMLEKFKAVRAEQIALLPSFYDVAWDSVCDTVWGPISLLWVVSKTYQHTAEHINDVMRIGLFWNFYAEEPK